MPEETEETIESLTKAVQGMMEILAAHSALLTNIVRTLENENIKIYGMAYRRVPLN